MDESTSEEEFYSATDSDEEEKSIDGESNLETTSNSATGAQNEQLISGMSRLDLNNENKTAEKVELREEQLEIKSTMNEEEVEFIVKNLDTGESFSSKYIEKFIPKGFDPNSIDPVAYDILQRYEATSNSGSNSQTKKENPESRKKKGKWLSSLESKIVSRAKTTTKKSDTMLFAQISRQLLTKHQGAIWVMKFSYDGSYMASGGNDKTVRVWKVLDDGTLFKRDY